MADTEQKVHNTITDTLEYNRSVTYIASDPLIKRGNKNGSITSISKWSIEKVFLSDRKIPKEYSPYRSKPYRIDKVKPPPKQKKAIRIHRQHNNSVSPRPRRESPNLSNVAFVTDVL